MWDEGEMPPPTRFCGVRHGLSAEMDRDRCERLKSLGNAIVPQVAFAIFKAIEAYDFQKLG